tara:strand:+ start:690 stop:860 length:171 start_codon:yes stop_codon:yes gene_type:complete
MAIRILLTGFFLAVHGVVPYINQPRYFKVSVLSDYLFEKDFQMRERVLLNSGKHRR